MEDGGTGTGFVCIHLHMRLPQIVPAHISRIIVNEYDICRRNLWIYGDVYMIHVQRDRVTTIEIRLVTVTPKR